MYCTIRKEVFTVVVKLLHIALSILEAGLPLIDAHMTDKSRIHMLKKLFYIVKLLLLRS